MILRYNFFQLSVKLKNVIGLEFYLQFSTAPSSTVTERQPRNRQIKLKPVRVGSKDRKATKPKDKTEAKLSKTTKGKF